MTDFVFDSFALTAYVENERGRIRVQQVIDEALLGAARIVMSVVNLGESLYTAERRRGAGGMVFVLNLVSELPISLVNIDMRLTISAARIKAVTPIAYGDCFAAALALEQDATLLTGDPEFRRLENVIKIEWLPQPERG